MEDIERPEIFRGHLDECARHFFGRIESVAPKLSRNATRLKAPMAEFCGVTLGSIANWHYNAILPFGATLIKLMAYLDMVGYRVIEWERIQPRIVRNFYELIGFGVFSPDEAAKILGVTTMSNVYRPLRDGGGGFSPERLQRMLDIWTHKREELEKKKTEAQETYKLDLSSTTPVTEEAPRAGSESLPSRKLAEISIMEGLLMLLERNPFSSSSKLSELKGSLNIVLRLSSVMNSLSSRLISEDFGGGGD